MIFTRGSLGTHLFELAYAIGKYNIKQKSLILNLHSTRACEAHAKKTNASKLVSNYRVCTVDVFSKRKQGCFSKDDFVRSLENFYQITGGGFDASFCPDSDIDAIGHIRTPDIAHMNRDSLQIHHNLEKIQQRFNDHHVSRVLSNDPKLRTEHRGENVLDDYKLLATSNKILGTFSMFSISSLLFKEKFDKKRQVIIFVGSVLEDKINDDLRKILNTRLGSQVSLDIISG